MTHRLRQISPAVERLRRRTYSVFKGRLEVKTHQWFKTPIPLNERALLQSYKAPALRTTRQIKHTSNVELPKKTEL